MIKKIITSIFLFTVFGINNIYAESSCEVESWPSKEIVNYITDLNSVLSEIQKEISTSNCWESWTWAFDNISAWSQKMFNSIISDFNSVINFGWYMSSWSFNTSPIFGDEMPQQFYRDHDYINNQINKINNISKIVWKKCATNIAPKWSKIKEVWNKYWFDTSTIWITLWWLRKFNTNLTVYFRCITSTTSSSCNLENEKLKSDIEIYYWEEAKKSCIKEKKSFKDIEKKISEITKKPFWFSAISKWIDEWKAAFSLLNWWDYHKTKYEVIEKELLKKELSRQWLSASQADAMLKNLDNCNKSTNWIAWCIANRINFWIRNWDEVKKKITQLIFSESKSTNEPTKLLSNIKQNEELIEEIEKMFNNIKINFNTSNNTLEKNIAWLVDLHNNLVNLNKTLIENIKISRELCNCQGSWMWSCN